MPDIAREEKLKVFQASAQLCALRTELDRRRQEIQKQLNVTFQDDETFLRLAEERHMPSRHLPVVVWILLLAAAATVFCLLIYLVVPFINQDLCVALGLACAFGCLGVYYSICRRDARLMAGQDLTLYHKEQEEFRRKVPALEKERQEVETEAERVRDALVALVPKGGIAEQYWDAAPILWGFVETHRADSLKEALNAYDDYMFYTQTLRTVRQQNAKIAAMERSITQLRQQQQATVAGMTMMEISHAVDMCLLIDYIDSK